jgi:uncharacterized SAM-binding protein YcdF (DUF218 family)
MGDDAGTLGAAPIGNNVCRVFPTRKGCNADPMGDDSLYWLKQFVKLLVLPPAGPLVVGLAGLALARTRLKTGWALTSIGVVSLTLLSIPAVAALLVRCLDQSPPLDLEQARSAQAIVVLGGGTRVHAPEYGGPTLGPVALERARYAARVARATDLPILVSGGAVKHARPEALMMRDVLVNEFGVPVRWVETRSRNTHENAVNSAALLKADGVRRVVLVGHAFDFPRTSEEFSAAGIESIRAPINSPPAVPSAFSDYMPSAAGLRLSYYALYEMLANVAYAVTSAIGSSSDTRSTLRSPSPPPRAASPVATAHIRGAMRSTRATAPARSRATADR